MRASITGIISCGRNKNLLNVQFMKLKLHKNISRNPAMMENSVEESSCLP